MISDRAMVRALNSTPQRVAATAPPGSLLKRHSIQPRKDAREATGQDAAYLAMIRTLPCLKCGMEPSEAAHVRYASAAFGKASALQKKPEDRFAVPLCAGCHRLDKGAQHTRAERAFWEEIGMNPLIVARDLYAQRGDVVAMRAVVMVAIAERSISPSSPSSSVAAWRGGPSAAPHADGITGFPAAPGAAPRARRGSRRATGTRGRVNGGSSDLRQPESGTTARGTDTQTTRNTAFAAPRDDVHGTAARQHHCIAQRIARGR